MQPRLAEALVARCREWYSQYAYHKVYRAVYDFATTDLSAVYFAKKDRMDLVMGITLGSTIQVGLLVAPLLVLASNAQRHPRSSSLLFIFSSKVRPFPRFLIPAFALVGHSPNSPDFEPT